MKKYGGNINLWDRPTVQTPEGPATLNSISVNIDGKEVLIPRVRKGLDRLMTDDEAVEYYLKTGEHLGIFDTPEEATAEGTRLSKEQYTHGPAKKLIDKLVGLFPRF